MAMFGYMTEIETVEATSVEQITATGYYSNWFSSIAHLFTGEDMHSLLFHFLDEFLFLFSADPFFIPRVSDHLLKLIYHFMCYVVYQDY